MGRKGLPPKFEIKGDEERARHLGASGQTGCEVAQNQCSHLLVISFRVSAWLAMPAVPKRMTRGGCQLDSGGLLRTRLAASSRCPRPPPHRLDLKFSAQPFAPIHESLSYISINMGSRLASVTENRGRGRRPCGHDKLLGVAGTGSTKVGCEGERFDSAE